MPTQAQAVREWAHSNGYTVGIRGVIAPAIWNAYAAAHPGFEREIPQSGTAHCEPGCGRRWVGFSEAHCMRCHLHFSTVGNFDAHLVYDPKRQITVCIDPLDTGLKVKDTVWGTIYVAAGSYWGSDDAEETADTLLG